MGIKTAAELINTYGDLDNLLDQAGDIKQPKRRENLLNFAEQARISRELVRLKEDVPLTLDLPDLVTPARDMDRLTAFLQEQEFNRLLVRIGAAEAPASSIGQAVRSMASSPAGNDHPAAGRVQDTSDRGAVDQSAFDAGNLEGALADMAGRDYQLITDVATLNAFLDATTAQGFVAVDTETTSLNAAAADLLLECRWRWRQDGPVMYRCGTAARLKPAIRAGWILPATVRAIRKFRSMWRSVCCGRCLKIRRY